jgi:hypothetical protein
LNLAKIPIRCNKAQNLKIPRNRIPNKIKPITTNLAKPVSIRLKLFHVEQFDQELANSTLKNAGVRLR